MTSARTGEFERIARYFAPLAAAHPGAFGLRDDAAVYGPAPGTELVITTDTIVEGVHFTGDEPAAQIAAKLLRVNLSDLAAKGAVPRAYTLNIALPKSVGDDWVAAFASGLSADQVAFDIVLIGGDSVATSGPACLTVTGFGEVPIGGIVRRRGARVGDYVFVSGTIGDGALGLLVAQEKITDLAEEDAAALLDRYRVPRPRVRLGQKLRGVASAMADISDGLVADLTHIATASGVGATIDAGAVPLSPSARQVLARRPEAMVTILTGGDDYELVFTASRRAAENLATHARETGTEITRIGSIGPGGKVVVRDDAGAPMTLTRAGYSHG